MGRSINDRTSYRKVKVTSTIVAMLLKFYSVNSFKGSQRYYAHVCSLSSIVVEFYLSSAIFHTYKDIQYSHLESKMGKFAPKTLTETLPF